MYPIFEVSKNHYLNPRHIKNVIQNCLFIYFKVLTVIIHTDRGMEGENNIAAVRQPTFNFSTLLAKGKLRVHRISDIH